MNVRQTLAWTLLFIGSFTGPADAGEYTVQVLLEGKTEWENWSHYSDVWDPFKKDWVRPSANENAQEKARQLSSGEVGPDTIRKVRIVFNAKDSRTDETVENGGTSGRPASTSFPGAGYQAPIQWPVFENLIHVI